MPRLYSILIVKNLADFVFDVVKRSQELSRKVKVKLTQR